MIEKADTIAIVSAAAGKSIREGSGSCIVDAGRG